MSVDNNPSIKLVFIVILNIVKNLLIQRSYYREIPRLMPFLPTRKAQNDIATQSVRENDSMRGTIFSSPGNSKKINGLLLTIVFLVWPSRASAHLVTTGLGPVYDGIGHLILTPEDLVPALALALFAGLRGAAPSRYTLFILPAAWLAGGLCGMLVDSLPDLPYPALSFMVLGAFIASDLGLSKVIVTVLAAGFGFLHGVFNRAVLQEGPGIQGMIGITAVLFVIAALASAFVVSLKKQWPRIAVRVTGSWIFASGLLMLGWFLKK